MTRTHIEIEENNSYISTKYVINDQQLVGNKHINITQFDGSNTYDTNYDFDSFKYLLTLKSDISGFTNKIHIISLSRADKKFFESIKELPHCTELIVDESVGLSKLPRISDEQFKVDDCPICLNPLYTRGEHVVVGLGPQGCGHRFHEECLNRHFLARDHNCPLCRRPITGVEYVTRAYQEPLPLSLQNDEVDPGNRCRSPLGCNILGGIKKRKTRKGRKRRINKKRLKTKSKRKNRI
jgi:hypothetical protein